MSNRFCNIHVAKTTTDVALMLIGGMGNCVCECEICFECKLARFTLEMVLVFVSDGRSGEVGR